MTRVVLGVLIGYAAWTVMWLGGNAVIFPGAQTGTPSPQSVLIGVLVLSVVCSLIAGWLAGAVAKQRAAVSVMALAALLLITGIGVQASLWTLMPVWYQVLFLALLVPMVIVGGRRRRASA